MVMFHSYVSLPEGILEYIQNMSKPDQRGHWWSLQTNFSRAAACTCIEVLTCVPCSVDWRSNLVLNSSHILYQDALTTLAALGAIRDMLCFAFHQNGSKRQNACWHLLTAVQSLQQTCRQRSNWAASKATGASPSAPWKKRHDLGIWILRDSNGFRWIPLVSQQLI